MTRRRDPPPPLDFGPDPHNPGPYHDNRPPARDPRGRATPEPPHHHHHQAEETAMKLTTHRATDPAPAPADEHQADDAAQADDDD